MIWKEVNFLLALFLCCVILNASKANAAVLIMRIYIHAVRLVYAVSIKLCFISADQNVLFTLVNWQVL